MKSVRRAVPLVFMRKTKTVKGGVFPEWGAARAWSNNLRDRVCLPQLAYSKGDEFDVDSFSGTVSRIIFVLERLFHPRNYYEPVKTRTEQRNKVRVYVRNSLFIPHFLLLTLGLALG